MEEDIQDQGDSAPLAGQSAAGRKAARRGGSRAAGRAKGASSSLRRALLITAAAALIPGLAHVRAGRTRTGAAMMAGFGLLATSAACAAFFVIRRRESLLLEIAIRPEWLAACAGVAAVTALTWVALISRSYLLVRPKALSRPRAIAGAAAVAIMCLVAALPPLFVARYAYLQRDLVTSVFSAETAPTGPPIAGARRPDAVAGRWTLPSRLNVLLVGGDADVGRPGVRSDSLTLASIDTATGGMTLLSLPRNLQHVPVWAGRHRLKSFPREELINEVYEYGRAHPRALDPPRKRNAGAELLKRTVGHILGLPVSYYGMVDMRSFRQLVDAMGGVRICVAYKVPVPRLPSGALRPGCRRLTGKEALWYARSRTASSDFSRMSRQKCLLWAIAEQASPITVLRRFQRLAEVFKYSVNTDIPRGLLPSLIQLSGKVRNARVTSIQFVPPLISTGRPDYAKIRKLARAAVREPGRADPHIHAMRTLNTSCR